MCDRGAVQLMGLVGVVVVKKELLIGLNGALRVQRDMTFSTRKDVADFNVGLTHDDDMVQILQMVLERGLRT